MTKLLSVLAVALLTTATATAQITLVDKGKARARICLADTAATSREAADFLNTFIERMTNARLPIAEGDPGAAAKGCVVIGGTTGEAGEDGYLISCQGGTLTIRSGGHRGAVYGVAQLLEQYLGVRYYAKEAYTYETRQTLRLPSLREADTPAFRFRQHHSYSYDDPDYRRWMRLEDSREVFAGNMWVHTFNQLLPADVWGKAHPEYYSYINGERRPGTHSQWCLTNPEVLRLAIHKVDSVFRAHPGMKTISVSQNDGNDTYCQCPECQKVNEYEGAPSGNFIRFVNKIAEHFPDKQISTLAYLFTMQPPKHAKPRENVNIMLCDIDCKREVPLTDNESGQYFMQALRGWSKISRNIFVWDYGINFDNMVSPFPNFHILRDNIRLFRQHHATMLFEQANGPLGTDFCEMRAYILAKLMWNPDLDTDSLMRDFLRGYYGAAAPYLYRYQQIMQGALLSSGTPLWIYDSPVSHKDGMLNRQCMKTYARLFDMAEGAVSDSPTLLRRVQIARLPLQYSELEIERTREGGDAAEMAKKLETFRSRAEQYKVLYLNERNNPVADYCRLYKTRFLPHENTNKAAGARVIWQSAPDEKYRPIADRALTDGLYGGASYVESWVGWCGRDADFTLDMGSEKTFSRVTADFLMQSGAWVLLPRSVNYSYSADGEHFQPLGTHEFAEDRDGSIRFIPGTVEAATPVKARYLRVEVKTIGLCPAWHYGVGYPAWFFIDEVQVE